MPTAVAQGFAALKRNLEITDLQASTVSARQQNVREVVAAELTVLDTFLTGSYRRSTMVAPLGEADIDMVVVVGSEYYTYDGHASLLDRVKCVLRKTYTKTPKISRNGQAVTITFTDFVIDVVPAFNRKGGGYLIPDAVLKRWVSTDPNKHVELWTEANKAHGGDLIPLIKMIKGWNKKHSQLLQSFHLETLVVQILNNVTISSFPSGVRYVFDKARMCVQQPAYDPAGYGGNIAAYLDTGQKIQEVVQRLESAYTKAEEAESLDADGKTERAFDKWRTIFGDYFPTYG